MLLAREVEHAYPSVALRGGTCSSQLSESPPVRKRPSLFLSFHPSFYSCQYTGIKVKRTDRDNDDQKRSEKGDDNGVIDRNLVEGFTSTRLVRIYLSHVLSRSEAFS